MKKGQLYIACTHSGNVKYEWIKKNQNSVLIGVFIIFGILESAHIEACKFGIMNILLHALFYIHRKQVFFSQYEQYTHIGREQKAA